MARSGLQSSPRAADRPVTRAADRPVTALGFAGGRVRRSRACPAIDSTARQAVYRRWRSRRRSRRSAAGPRQAVYRRWRSRRRSRRSAAGPDKLSTAARDRVGAPGGSRRSTALPDKLSTPAGDQVRRARVFPAIGSAPRQAVYRRWRSSSACPGVPGDRQRTQTSCLPPLAIRFGVPGCSRRSAAHPDKLSTPAGDHPL